MASAPSLSRQGLRFTRFHGFSARPLRPIHTLVAAPLLADSVTATDLEGSDRTHEASTSASAPLAKSGRARPTLLKPGVIGDTLIFENGVVLVDKPLEWTSFDVCNKLRHMVKFTGVKKVGHAGTLDPNATGLLIVCTGKGTKFCDDFMAENKEYSGTLRLGEGTASYDAECEVSERAPWEHITDSDLEAAAARFVGDIMQVPPMFSALKVGGQKLYQLAREGQALDLPARPVTINSFRLWRSEESRQEVHFHVTCSKGTYIRSLAFDLGRALGSAAHLVALRREASGDYRVADAWELTALVAELERLRQEVAPLTEEQRAQQQRPRQQQRGQRRGSQRRRLGQEEGVQQEVQQAVQQEPEQAAAVSA